MRFTRRMKMIPYKTLVEEYEKIVHKVLHWNDSKEKILNIVSVPYNTSAIFVDVILKYVTNKRKVLFVTNEEHEKIDIIDNIKKYSSFRDYSYIRKGTGATNIRASLFISNHENALNFSQEFELVIYDDVSSFSRYRKYEILDFLASQCRAGARVICRSVEPVFQNAFCIDLPVKDCKLPIAEPRIITTRIDVNKEIPYVVYEYLNWSIESDRKVVILVPDEERGENVYGYLSIFREKLHNNIMYFNKEINKKSIVNFMKSKSGIIIMKYNEELNIDLVDTDIMVYFADDKCFDYKRLVYICGKVGRSPGLGNGEVIFLAREMTKEMEIAKDMARGFNKQAWEMGLLSV
jgi:late competence protein required for DNA uptake (superfamily II DNA/RNA helicase)